MMCIRPVHTNIVLEFPKMQGHLKIQVLGAGTWHLAHHLNLVSGVSLKRAFKMQFRNAYFRSLVHSSRKLWPKPD